jgi:hypothetical protein
MQMLSNLAFSPRGIFPVPGPFFPQRALNADLFDLSPLCATAWFPQSGTANEAEQVASSLSC